jgi:hypothetical protein
MTDNGQFTASTSFVEAAENMLLRASAGGQPKSAGRVRKTLPAALHRLCTQYSLLLQAQCFAIKPAHSRLNGQSAVTIQATLEREQFTLHRLTHFASFTVHVLRRHATGSCAWE